MVIIYLIYKKNVCVIINIIMLYENELKRFDDELKYVTNNVDKLNNDDIVTYNTYKMINEICITVKT